MTYCSHLSSLSLARKSLSLYMSLRQQIRLFLRSTQVPRASLGVSSSRKTHANVFPYETSGRHFKVKKLEGEVRKGEARSGHTFWY
jgi:hypothetical protein